jgi:hypothetical protein
MKHRGKKAKMHNGVMAKEPTPANAGGNADVEKEAKAKTVGIIGGAAPKRLDRARGGRVGADKSPLSASSSKHPITSAGKC